MKHVICPDCGGDGKATCHNPEHAFSFAVGEFPAFGCPICGHDPDHKIMNWTAGKWIADPCDSCSGTGALSPELAVKWLIEFGPDDEIDLREVPSYPGILPRYHLKIIMLAVIRFPIGYDDAAGLLHLAKADLRIWMIFLELVDLGLPVGAIHFHHLRDKLIPKYGTHKRM